MRKISMRNESRRNIANYIAGGLYCLQMAGTLDSRHCVEKIVTIRRAFFEIQLLSNFSSILTCE